MGRILAVAALDFRYASRRGAKRIEIGPSVNPDRVRIFLDTVPQSNPTENSGGIPENGQETGIWLAPRSRIGQR